MVRVIGRALGITTIAQYQRAASAGRPIEPYAAVALSYQGPVGHPTIEVPNLRDDGDPVSLRTAPSVQQITHGRIRGIVAVAVFGVDAADYAQYLDFVIHGDTVRSAIQAGGVVLHPTPVDTEDATAIRDDIRQESTVRMWPVSWAHTEELPIYTIEELAETEFSAEEST
jgi:hypothetical protein